jgi:hypothetical protein
MAVVDRTSTTALQRLRSNRGEASATRAGGRRSHPDELLRAHLSDSRPGSSSALMLSMLDTATCIHPGTSSIYFSSRSSLPVTTIEITPSGCHPKNLLLVAKENTSNAQPS